MTTAQPNTEQTPRSTVSAPNPGSPELAVLPPPTAPHAEAPCETARPPAATPAPSPSKPRTRNGKIARLPYLERDMVNRMLRNNLHHSKIAEALDEHGYHVTVRNISNWKTRGGYKEWRLEDDRALATRLLQDNLTEHLRKNDASQLPEVGLQLAATHLSQFFLKPETQQQLASDPEKYARPIAILCRLAAQIHALQKYRDDSAKELGPKFNPERIKREALENTEITRSVYSAAKLGRSIHESNTPHRNYIPKSD